MGFPLIVKLVEIRLAEVQTLALSPDLLNFYPYFLEEGLGAFRDRFYAETFQPFINSLTDVLPFNQVHPSFHSHIPLLDVPLLHPDIDKSTSVYRKPTHPHQPQHELFLLYYELC